MKKTQGVYKTQGLSIFLLFSCPQLHVPTSHPPVMLSTSIVSPFMSSFCFFLIYYLYLSSIPFLSVYHVINIYVLSVLITLSFPFCFVSSFFSISLFFISRSTISNSYAHFLYALTAPSHVIMSFWFHLFPLLHLYYL